MRTNELQNKRSLLQKAVRYGDVELMNSVFNELWEIDKTWLKHRTYVIACEECYPVLNLKLSNPREILEATTNSVKNREAAGLGSLIYNNNEILVKSYENEYLYKASKSGLPWDKKFIEAAEFLLRTNSNIPNKASKKLKCENWIAIDGHTDDGKKALNIISTKYNITYAKLKLGHFLTIGGAVNEVEDSFYWKKSVSAKMQNVNTSVKEILEIEQLLRNELPTIINWTYELPLSLFENSQSKQTHKI